MKGELRLSGRKILVTGSSGLVGRRVIPLASKIFDEVRALDLRKPSSSETLESYDNVIAIQGDVLDRSLVKTLVEGVDVVIHLAAPSCITMFEEAPADSVHTTVIGFLNVIESVRCAKVPKLVFASTAAVYEGNEFPYEENMSLDPPDLKALSKLATEQIAQRYARRYGVDAFALRPFSVYGDDELHKERFANAISLFSWAMVGGQPPVLWGTGEQTRDFVHADDAARAFVLAATRDCEHTVLNLASGKETTFVAVIDIINSLLDYELPPVHAPCPLPVYANRLLGSTRRAQEALGFRCQIEVEEGISRVVAFAKKAFKENPTLATAQRRGFASDARHNGKAVGY